MIFKQILERQEKTHQGEDPGKEDSEKIKQQMQSHEAGTSSICSTEQKRVWEAVQRGWGRCGGSKLEGRQGSDRSRTCEPGREFAFYSRDSGGGIFRGA